MDDHGLCSSADGMGRTAGMPGVVCHGNARRRAGRIAGCAARAFPAAGRGLGRCGPCRRGKGDCLVGAGQLSAREWGRRQAACAPRWSVSKRRRMARSFGVVLGEERADPGEGCSRCPEPENENEQEQEQEQ